MIIALTMSLIILTCLVLWLFITLSKTPMIKWITYLVIPFLLFNVGFTWHTINDILGQATEQTPVGKLEVIAVHLEKPYLYVVVRQEGADDPTFHKLPDNEKNRKAAAQAKTLMKKGVRLSAEIKKGDDNTPNGIEFYKWDHQKSMPKDGN